jgi:general secretion pathway protein D
MKKIILAICLTISVNLLAADNCQDLAKCVETVSQLTGKKYIYSGKLEGELKSSSNFAITAENADTMFSYILNASGYARIPTIEKDTFKIIMARDIRYESVSALKADLTTTPIFPASEDYVLLTYKFTNFKDGQPRELSNTLRPFMSRYGRIIELIDSVTIQEMATKLPQQLEFMRKIDHPLSKDELAIKKQKKIDHDKRSEREAKQEKSGPKENKK